MGSELLVTGVQWAKLLVYNGVSTEIESKNLETFKHFGRVIYVCQI